MSQFETCGQIFKTKKAAIRFARNIANALRLTGKSKADSRVPVYELKESR